MLRITNNQRLYALTHRDVERIKSLLVTVEEAVTELINYRCVKPIDPSEDFPVEDAVYQQTSQIMRNCEPRTEELF